ncbi:TetR/AcrR family transcriptional regulator [Thermococcus thermotolerans]|uniref:TetR/AcrR family transcriptional regulator n=1 Tax=Thermococcus thermotolerans TaxID=2969672 RepID=UPI002157556D|nr:TetR/AcrR family transcriptional regulator [Thermococcus thermotolerans]
MMGKLETKKRIINAAFELFSEKSYRDVSMEEIARKAGISKGGLFHHFPSKYELARVVLFTLLDEWLENLTERLDELSGREKLKTLVDAAFELIMTSPKLSRFFLELYEESLRLNRTTDWDEFYERYIGSVSSVLREAGVEEPEKKALLLGALIDGLALHHLLSDGKLFNVEDMKREVLRIMGG